MLQSSEAGKLDPRYVYTSFSHIKPQSSVHFSLQNHTGLARLRSMMLPPSVFTVGMPGSRCLFLLHSVLWSA